MSSIRSSSAVTAGPRGGREPLRPRVDWRARLTHPSGRPLDLKSLIYECLAPGRQPRPIGPVHAVSV